MSEQQVDSEKKVRRRCFQIRRRTTRRTLLVLATALVFVLVSLIPHSDPNQSQIAEPIIKEEEDIGRHDLAMTMKDLPPIVQLSPGANKYVLVEAVWPSMRPPKNTSRQPQSTTLWFVKSSSPQECGGEYHRYVARALVQRLRSLGWHVEVTGGGRIQYDAEKQQAVVYGYSNRYGKGDHVLAAKLISENTDIQVSYNLSDTLY